MLLPGLDAKQTTVRQVMTANPVTVTPADKIEGCMTLMSSRGFRHLPVLDAGKVVGVISIGDVVKYVIRDLELSVHDLKSYIMTDGPGAEARAIPSAVIGHRTSPGRMARSAPAAQPRPRTQRR